MGDSREALILEMRAENELSPEVTKAIQQLDRFEVSAEETAQIFDRAFAKTQARLGAFVDASASAAAEIEGNWRQTTKSIDQLAEQIAKSGGSAGNIDLDTAKANAQVKAARDKLAALKLLEAAQVNAAASEGRLTAASEQYIAAIRQAIVVQEAEVKSLGAQAGALERLEIELRQVNAASAGFQEQSHRTTMVSGQTRAGMQQLSFQLNDVAVQFAAGTSPMIIFAQQSGQVIQAIQMMSGEAKGFIGFLGGPWGMAITSALVVLTPFIAKLWETDDALDEVGKSAQDAMAKLNAAVSSASAVTDAATDRTKKLVNALGEIAKVNRDIAQTKQLIDGLGANPLQAGLNAQSIGQAYRTLSGLEARRSELQGQIKGFREDLAQVGAVSAVQRIQDSNRDRLNERTRRGPSAETLARREEAARLKLLDQDTAYAEQERQARHKLLEATRKTTESEAMRDQLLREDINAEAAAQKIKIQNQLSSKDISDEQAKHLLDLNERTRQQRLQNLYIQRASETLREQADRQIDDLEQQIAMLRIEEGMASTARERREIGLRLLELEKQKEKIALQTIADDQLRSEEDRARAKRRLGNLDQVYEAKEGQVRDQTAGSMEQYKKRLQEAVGGNDALNESFERVQAEGVQSLEDGLVGIISGTESVGQAFKRMADQIIADLIRIAVQKLFVDQLFSAIGLGGSGGGFGSAASINSSALDSLHSTPLPGFATGGRIFGPGTGTSDSVPIWASHGEFVVNARSTAQFLPALEAINSGRIPKLAKGGLVTPSLPASMRRGVGGGNARDGSVKVEIVPSDYFDARVMQNVGNAAPMLIEAGGERGYAKVIKKNRRRLS